MGEKRIAFMISVGIPEGKRPLGRSMHSWENSITVGLKERGCGLD
jgi:hypothetical protein